MRIEKTIQLLLWLALFLALTSCSDDTASSSDSGSTDVSPDLPGTDDATPDQSEDSNTDPPSTVVRDPAPESDGIYGFANGCFTVEGFDGRVEPTFIERADGGAAFAFTADTATGAERFHMRASDLGTYLLYDTDRHYFVAVAAEDDDREWHFERAETLQSDIQLLDNSFRSPAEWTVQVSTLDSERFQLQHYQTGYYLTLDGLTDVEDEAAVITFFEAEGCAQFPELTIDATGAVEPRQWEDGDVYGIAEMHSHIMTNYGFGGGGMFHGHAFHRLGVEHALGSCEAYHGVDGKKDLIGLFYDGGIGLDVDVLLPILANGQTEDFNHHTDGYPEFTDWPNGWNSSTHTTLYYRWIERAYLGGLRLVVQLATGNSVLCDFVTGLGSQTTRYSCNDMVSVLRTIEEVRNLERYIDAQAGGPGLGWFRVVETPAQAREVINQGNLAVVLGIEISNLFDCFLTPPDGFEACDEDTVRAELDQYYDLGVRVIFPVHKFDNAFAAGDGGSNVIELGNFVNSGHYTNLVDDCPYGAAGFDSGDVTFGGLNRPREVYDSPAPVDMSSFPTDPLFTLLPFLNDFQSDPLRGNYCQNAGMTELGETLVNEMMARGMLVDLAHLPQRGVERALEMHRENDYPATSTHGQTYGGELYEIGGMTGRGFHGCANLDQTGSIGQRYISETQRRIEAGIFPGGGFAFDFNGFAGSRRPRLGENSHCSQPQSNPVTYPFSSHNGDIEFQEPQLGNRTVDFNTEGMLHIGLLPELIEDARRDGMTDEDLEPLFRSAEGWIRMWEQAESRAAELGSE